MMAGVEYRWEKGGACSVGLCTVQMCGVEQRESARHVSRTLPSCPRWYDWLIYWKRLPVWRSTRQGKVRTNIPTWRFAAPHIVLQNPEAHWDGPTTSLGCLLMPNGKRVGFPQDGTRNSQDAWQSRFRDEQCRPSTSHTSGFDTTTNVLSYDWKVSLKGFTAKRDSGFQVSWDLFR